MRVVAGELDEDNRLNVPTQLRGCVNSRYYAGLLHNEKQRAKNVVTARHTHGDWAEEKKGVNCRRCHPKVWSDTLATHKLPQYN